MVKKKMRGFTLIELIAVLVIMAIIALIVTPLVMNIIRKARVSADKRSIDAYGRSIELAVASYLLDTGKFPTSIEQLTVEYSGSEVVCETTQLNSDSSVYLTGCTVAGRTVDYVYGSDKTPSYTAYNVGDEVTYNNVDYYVIKNSGAKEESLTLLKKNPLTEEEVNEYGIGHINRYTRYLTGRVYNNNGYGGMAYYTSGTCGYVNYSWVRTGCTTDYSSSDIKYAVDMWSVSQAPAATEARLIQYEELIANLGYENNMPCTDSCYYSGILDNVPSWLYNSNYEYWTMSQNNDLSSFVWKVPYDGNLTAGNIDNINLVVRPVIVLPKSALSA